MEAQNVILRGHIHGAVPSHKTHVFTEFRTAYSPKRCSAAGVSTKIGCSFQSISSVTERNIRCRSSVERVEHRGAIDAEEEKPKPLVRRKNLAVFVSGGGSNFRSIHEATRDGSVHGDIVVLIASKYDCGGAVYASERGIPVIVFPERKSAQESFTAKDLVLVLRSYKVDLILLAGYLKLIPTELIKAYQKAILNIHPSLLPAFGGKGYYGMKVHKAVIASGARYSGPTIHYVDEEYDTGRILAQRVVPVLAKDTPEDLAARVLHQEHELYVEVCAALCEERIVWREDGIPIIRSKQDPNDFR